jgi:alkaline phosphatase
LKGSADINTNLAKNVILFVGDGMSLPTVTAARIYKAQYEGRQLGAKINGEESYLTFEKLPHVGLSKVGHTDTSLTSYKYLTPSPFYTPVMVL